MQTLTTATLIAITLFFSGCASTPPANIIKPSEVWACSSKTCPFEAESIAGSVVLPVAYNELNHALRMLAHRNFVPLNSSTAERFIGKPFSASKALKEEAAYNTERAKFFTERLATNPNSDSDKEAVKEHQDRAKSLLAQRGKAKPYLMRANGLPGCGTGGYGAQRVNNEVWTSFGGLGSGYLAARYAIIVYLDRPPTEVHVQLPATCM